jgi:glutathione S-transferase
MKLYYYPGACSLVSHIALREAGLDFQLERVDLGSKQTESGADFRTISAKGYVPALGLDDGSVLTEGVAIALFIAQQAPAKALAPPPGSFEFYRLLEWMTFISTELHKSTGALFNPNADEKVRAFLSTILNARFDLAEKLVGAGPYVMGASFTVADIYLFVICSWLPHVGIDPSRWPNLAAHTARVAARPAVLAALTAEGLIKG